MYLSLWNNKMCTLAYVKVDNNLHLETVTFSQIFIINKLMII